MNTNALTRAVATDQDYIAAFSKDGTERNWSEILAEASRIKAFLSAVDGERWALDLDDTDRFASALLGCWAAGRTPVLATRQVISNDADPISIDGAFTSAQELLADSRFVSVDELPAAHDSLTSIPAHSEIVLYTSGSSGRAKEVCRRVENLEAELVVFESLWGEMLGHCRVYSTVSHRHVYGLLFSALWPIVSRRPFASFDLSYPEQLTDSRSTGNALISSPALLKRLGAWDGLKGSWCAVFSAGSLLPADAASDSRRVLGACPIEVYGSTETSGVAWRQQVDSDSSDWTILPTVEIRLDSEDFLEVKSRFTGEDGWVRVGDHVRLISPTSFELLGRGDRIAKIEDKRVSLAEIEDLLIRTPFVVDAAAIALEEGTRQSIAVAIQLNERGEEEMARIGRRGMGDSMREALRVRIELVALPRRIRYVDEIPINSQGKREHAVIARLFDSS